MEKNIIIDSCKDSADIALILCDAVGTKNKQDFEDIENALYHIKTIAENKYNFDYWRTFYNSLLTIAENY